MEQVPAEDDRFRALGRPAQDEYALWEMALEWEGLNDADAQLAAALRLFVITRDPLDWIPDRGSAWATSNADGDTLELPVYVTLATIRDVLDDEDRVVAVLGGLVNRALSTAIACQGVVFSGAHPALAVSGQAPRLLDGNAYPPTGDEAPVGIGRPRVCLRSPGWEPLGLGAIQDLVQEAFGPVDFDRSQVRLDPVEVRHGGCPACAGQRFGFPADLQTAALSMCAPHRDAAYEIADQRIARAKQSNPPGWRALGKASARTSGVREPAGHPMPPRQDVRPGRNDPCPCGSGRKYKRCCGAS